jgi:hypothetical protein
MASRVALVVCKKGPVIMEVLKAVKALESQRPPQRCDTKSAALQMTTETRLEGGERHVRVKDGSTNKGKAIEVTVMISEKVKMISLAPIRICHCLKVPSDRVQSKLKASLAK